MAISTSPSSQHSDAISTTPQGDTTSLNDIESNPGKRDVKTFISPLIHMTLLVSVLCTSSIAYFYYFDGGHAVSNISLDGSSFFLSSLQSIPFVDRLSFRENPQSFNLGDSDGGLSYAGADDGQTATHRNLLVDENEINSVIHKSNHGTTASSSSSTSKHVPFNGIDGQTPNNTDDGQTTTETEGISYDTKVVEGEEGPLRVLHIVTALAEYNNGRRNTISGEDRLQKVMIPILVDSVESMISEPYNYQVDVYLVLGWKLLPERRKLIEDALPEGVGLQIWDDATPLGYDAPQKDDVIKPVTRGLARQHRFVIKDKLFYYDFFTVFEDDMRITGGHIAHYLQMTEELNQLRAEAPETTPEKGESAEPHGNQKFHGTLTKRQLRRMIPGFIRVEALIDDNPTQSDLGPIPVDLDFPVNGDKTQMAPRMFDAKPCCHVRPGLGKLPPSPKGDEIMIWETATFGAVVRQMPQGGSNALDWVLLQPGPKIGSGPDFIGGYWSGRDGAYGDKQKPSAGMPDLIAQQGGFMLTRDQIIDIHLNLCSENFFPPFDEPFNQDGLTLMNVEFWSGGFQLFGGGRGGCNMQRVIDLNPDQFSKHFIYHTANNKQKQIGRHRLLKANNFMGQLNSVVKAADRAKQIESIEGI